MQRGVWLGSPWKHSRGQWLPDIVQHRLLIGHTAVAHAPVASYIYCVAFGLGILRRPPGFVAGLFPGVGWLLGMCRCVLSRFNSLYVELQLGRSLYWSTGAARSVACRKAGTQSGTPLRQDLAASSPQCDIKRPVSNGSDHIASWITEPDLFWKTGEARGGPDTQLPAMRYKTPQEQWDRSYCILDYRARHATNPETYN